MLDRFVTAFQSFFSRAFWFGSFLPVAIFAFIHLLLAWMVFGGELVPLPAWLAAKGDALTLFPAVFAGLVVIAYALTPIVPLLRGLLDGSLLPERLHDLMRREHLTRARRIKQEINAAFELSETYQLLTDTLVRRMSAARDEGTAKGHIGDANAIEKAKQEAKKAKQEVKKLRNSLKSNKLPTPEELEGAIQILVTALSGNNADLSGPGEELDQAQNAMVSVLRNCQTEARYRWDMVRTRYSRIAYNNPQGTRMADARVISESYCFRMYQVDFEYIWPRLQLVLPAQTATNSESFEAQLAAARSQIDFAVLSLAMALTIPAVWLPVMAWTSDAWPLYLATGVGGLLAARFFYELAVESQFAFGEVVKSAIDRYRFDVIEKLRLPLPMTLSTERALWSKLRRVNQAPGADDLVYRHPPKAGAG